MSNKVENDSFPHIDKFLRSLITQQAEIERFASKANIPNVPLVSIPPHTPYLSRLIEQFAHSKTISIAQLADLRIAFPPYVELAKLGHMFPSSAGQLKTVNEYLAAINFVSERESDEREVFTHPETDLLIPATHERIIIYSSSIRLLEQLRARHITLHDLTWRQFEEVVAELLTQDGFTVELGRGTKDDGKDIVAVKEVQGVGLVMSVWQAKKLNSDNKVGIRVIRELADTRNKLDASKGVIVTTTSLTSGALKRIEQDRYLLHKVDGHDLLTWIQKT